LLRRCAPRNDGIEERAMKITRQMAKTRFETVFDQIARELADKFFRIVSWTIYQSLLITIYIRTSNVYIWFVCAFGFLLMFLFIHGYIRDWSYEIAKYFKIEEKPLFFVPLILLSGLITYGMVRLSTAVAVEIATYGR
jgi:hypothetical protein